MKNKFRFDVMSQEWGMNNPESTPVCHLSTKSLKKAINKYQEIYDRDTVYVYLEIFDSFGKLLYTVDSLFLFVVLKEYLK